MNDALQHCDHKVYHFVVYECGKHKSGYMIEKICLMCDLAVS